MYRSADLFAGIGGIRLGFDQAFGQDIECIFAAEKDKFARQTYSANFSTPETIVEDVTKINAVDMPDFDICLAGIPCTSFSSAGQATRKSLRQPVGFEDKVSGTLFFDFARILKSKQPSAFLLENVKNLPSHDKGRTFAIMKDVLTNDLGYHIHYKIIDAALFTCQHRERIYVVGFRDDLPFSWDDLQINRIHTSVADILEPEVDDKYTLSDKMWSWLQAHAAKHAAKGNGFGYSVIDGTFDHTRTLSARYHKDGSEILISQKDRNPRRLTPRECARLQGFPDDFIFPVSNTQAYKQLGNSVSVPTVQAIANLVRQSLERS